MGGSGLRRSLLVWTICPLLILCNCRYTPELIELTEDGLRVVSVSGEWRTSWLVKSGQPVRVQLGSVMPDQVLRIGVRDVGAPGVPVKVRIKVNGKTIDRLQTESKGEWRDWVIELPEAFAGGECAVEMLSGHPFYVSALNLESKAETPVNVLVYLVDTLRGDHLSCYGYERNTSPHIDALAADGVRFLNAVPQSSWTRPAVASLLTSTYPGVHGANDRSQRMRPDLHTLEGALGTHGYATMAFMSNPSCTPYWGIGQDFERFVDVDSTRVEPDKDTRVVDAALEALALVEHRPWFFYVHTIAPHDPYEAPEPYGSRFLQENYTGSETEQMRARTVDAYDGEIAYTDAQFGRLIAGLKARGLYDNTLIVFLSDHGEEFWEHGELGHGHNLFEPQLDIPLIVKLPKQAQAGTVREDLVELIDVAPTVLSLLELPRPAKFQGRTILPEAPPRTTPAFASLELERANMRMTRDVRFKYIHDVVESRETWYDLTSDPDEQHPLVSLPSGVQELAAHAQALTATGAPGLHLIATGSLEDGRLFAGSVRGQDLGAPLLHYAAENGLAWQDGDGVHFEIGLAPGANTPGALQDWLNIIEKPNYAHLYIPCEPQPLEFDLAFDSRPLPGEMLVTPMPDTEVLLAGSAVTAEALQDGAQHFEPATLATDPRLYVWYQPPSQVVTDADVDPQMLEALEALGYLR